MSSRQSSAAPLFDWGSAQQIAASAVPREPPSAKSRVPEDICQNRHKGNAYSVAANPTSLQKDEIRATVMQFAIGQGARGITADEVAAAWDCSPNHVAPRITELKAKGHLVDSGDKRATRSGKFAAVLIAKRFQ